MLGLFVRGSGLVHTALGGAQNMIALRGSKAAKLAMGKHGQKNATHESTTPADQTSLLALLHDFTES